MKKNVFMLMLTVVLVIVFGYTVKVNAKEVTKHGITYDDELYYADWYDAKLSNIYSDVKCSTKRFLGFLWNTVTIPAGTKLGSGRVWCVLLTSKYKLMNPANEYVTFQQIVFNIETAPSALPGYEGYHATNQYVFAGTNAHCYVTHYRSTEERIIEDYMENQLILPEMTASGTTTVGTETTLGFSLSNSNTASASIDASKIVTAQIGGSSTRQYNAQVKGSCSYQIGYLTYWNNKDDNGDAVWHYDYIGVDGNSNCMAYLYSSREHVGKLSWNLPEKVWMQYGHGLYKGVCNSHVSGLTLSFTLQFGIAETGKYCNIVGKDKKTIMGSGSGRIKLDFKGGN